MCSRFLKLWPKATTIRTNDIRVVLSISPYWTDRDMHYPAAARCQACSGMFDDSGGTRVDKRFDICLCHPGEASESWAAQPLYLPVIVAAGRRFPKEFDAYSMIPT